MAPSIPVAQANLGYPLACVDFDPFNPDFLLVGGGGGSSSTGVPNKLSLIDCSKSHELQQVVDIELSKTEDSVTCLALAQSTESSLTAYAGINSSPADQKTGKNEHFRSFRIDLPRKRRASEGPAPEGKADAVQGRTEALGRAQFFRTQTGPNDVYQRIVRLSPPSQDTNKPRVTAIATGLATHSEIVLLKAGPAPGVGNEIARLSLVDKEAVGLDFAPASDQGEEDGGVQYTMAYCSDYEVSLYNLFGGKEGVRTQTAVVYSTPESPGKGPRPRFKGLRFLSPKHILLLQNLPNRKGVELLILRRHKDGISAVISFQKRLSKNMKMATGLDVCILSASPEGDRQILVAVVGQNSTVEILHLEFSKRTGMSSFSPYTTLTETHSGPITGVAFSNFVPPTLPVTRDTKAQFVRLATVGVEQTVFVHTFPLRPFPPPPNKSPRYVLKPPVGSDLLSTIFGTVMAIVVIGIAAFLLQVFSEVRGAVPPFLGATDWLPPNVKNKIAQPYIFGDSIPVVPILSKAVPEAVKDPASVVSEMLQDNEYYTQMLADAVTTDLPAKVESVAAALTDLVAEHAADAVDAAAPPTKAIVMRDEGHELSAEVHHDVEAAKEDEALRKWEDLHEHERVGWRKRLIDAGHWTVDQGESVLKGVFFSELAGLMAGDGSDGSDGGNGIGNK